LVWFKQHKNDMRRLLVLTVSLLGMNCGLAVAGESLVIDLWPGHPPGEVRSPAPEVDTSTAESRMVAGKPVIRIGNVSVPQITVFKPDPEIATGTSVIVAPGGGYNILAYDLEGAEVVAWLNSLGITGILLKYRVPGSAYKDQAKWKAGVQDAQRAVSLVRSRAEELGIDASRVGLMGFSAGGHAAGMTTFLTERQYAPVDDHDRASFRPDFTGIIYLGYDLLREPGIQLGPDLPPVFMAVSQDDKDRGIYCARLFVALKEAGVPAELHVFVSGGHGYGLRDTERPAAGWPRLMADWMRQVGVL
jgi:acetyl esterase/lipase